MILLGVIGIWQIIILPVFLLLLILPVLALIKLLKNEHEPTNRLLWIVVIIMLPILGSTLYLIMRSGTSNRNEPLI